jgi:hypothetical protein
MAALAAGYRSVMVIIGTTTGEAPDRENVRAALSRSDHVNVNPDSDGTLDLPPVRFTDE